MADKLSQLPIEVFQHILQTIADKSNHESLTSLNALIRVNRYTAHVTLPFLYCSPFTVLLSSTRKNWNREILKTLLEDIPLGDDGLSKAMVLEFKIRPLSSPSLSITNTTTAATVTTTTSPPSKPRPRPRPLNYLSHLHHLNISMSTFLENILRRRHKLTRDELVIIEGDEDPIKQTTSNRRMDAKELKQSADNYKKKEKAWYLHQSDLYRDTVWALAVPVLGQLESLTFPILGIWRWTTVVDSLERLETLVFILDETFDRDYINTYFPAESIPVSQQQRKWLMADEEAEAMQAMVFFVNEHTRHFRGRLKSVNAEGRKHASCPYFDFVHFRQKINGILPPMHRPTFLYNDNWMRLVAHPDTTDLGYVKEISARHGMWRDIMVHTCEQYSRFLERCRVLRRLHSTPLGTGSFQWAVMEKKSVLEGKRKSDDLVPLERVEIRDYDDTTDEADAIAFAFSDTLRHLYIQDNIEIFGLWWPRYITIGHGWVEMPVLTHLTVVARRCRLLLDKLLLFHCPNIVNVHLADATTTYRCQDIKSTLPAHLGKLNYLRLEGRPALTFHPATLGWATELKTLRLCVDSQWSQPCFIPPVEELSESYGDPVDSGTAFIGTGAGGGASAQAGAGLGGGVSELSMAIQRPIWSWDWKLKQLDDLEITGELAFRFQFRMLCGCPALKCLTLKTMTAEEGSHIRVLTRADFFIPDTDVFDDIDSSEPTAPPARQPKCVIAYSLHILKMTGQWVLDDSLVPVFFYDTFPKLRTMTLKGVSGFTLPALVDCLRTKAMRISELVTTIPGPTTEEGRELGLVRRIGRRMELEYWDYGVTLRGGEEYKLLKDPRKGWE